MFTSSHSMNPHDSTKRRGTESSNSWNETSSPHSSFGGVPISPSLDRERNHRQHVASACHGVDTPRGNGNPQSPNISSRSHSPGHGMVDLSTSLGTLTTVLMCTRSYHACARESYRTNHKLFRDAKDRTMKAHQALTQAQAEYEHATTAQEYAHSELQNSLITKQLCEDRIIQIERQIRKASGEFQGKRIQLKGLTQNVQWNGRTGTIIKLVAEGQDCGRWKIRLDQEVRGGDPDGRDGRDLMNGEACDVSMLIASEKVAIGNVTAHHVVAKAENLRLLEDDDPTANDVAISTTMPRSRLSNGDTFSKCRDPSTSRHYEDEYHRKHTSDQQRVYNYLTSEYAAVVSPERDDNIYYDCACTPLSHNPREVAASLSPDKSTSPRSQTQEKDLSSAFSTMLLSPVSFEDVSFTVVHSNSVGSPTNGTVDQQRSRSNEQSLGGIIKSDSPVTGLFFNEIPSLDQSSPRAKRSELGLVEGKDSQRGFHQEEKLELIDGPHRGYPQEIYSSDVPTLVILPADNELIDERPPHCIGVRGAGVPHINGVYLLTTNQNYPGSSQSSPIYFKDSPPTLLEDDRLYDMCILRIDCPDSGSHVIWFLARVDVDPSCLDVKFSDCYYYCRLPRSNDVGNDCPPLRGWNIPRAPPGIAIAPSMSFSQGSSCINGPEMVSGGIGIEPRSGPMTRDFMSPSIETNTTKYSF